MVDIAIESFFMVLIYFMIIFTDFVQDKKVQYNAGSYFLGIFCLVVILNFSVMSYNTVVGMIQMHRLKGRKKLQRIQLQINEK